MSTTKTLNKLRKKLGEVTELARELHHNHDNESTTRLLFLLQDAKLAYAEAERDCV